MFKNTILSIAIISTLFSSCKDGNKIEPAPIPDVPKEYANYSQLKIGNYWVYQIYDVDSLGEGFATQVFDSCYIDRDTIIRNNKYYGYIDPINASQYIWLRDSLHYIIDSYGYVCFSSEDYSNFFNNHYELNGSDTFFHRYSKMLDKDLTFNTPAGSFVTSDFRTTFEIFQPMNEKKIVKSHARYAKNIGLISKTMPFYTQEVRFKEKRLLRYHLN